MSLVIGFAKPKGWFIPLSWAIRLVEWIGWSHTYFRYRNGEDKIFETNVYEGCVERLTSEMTKTYQIVMEYEFELTLDEMQRFDDFKARYVGKKYGLLKLAGILAARIFRLKSNPFPNGTVCSEVLCQFMIENPDIFFFNKKITYNPQTVGLGQITELLISSPRAIRRLTTSTLL